MSKKFIFTAIFLAELAFSGSVSGVISSGAYTFSRRNLSDQSLLHTRLYQSFYFSGNDLFRQNGQFRFSGVFYYDPVHSFDTEPAIQIYNLNYVKSLLKDRAKIVLGRQFVYSTSVTGRMDGLNAEYQIMGHKIRLFGGVYIPGTGFPGNPIKNHLIGGEMDLTLPGKIGLRFGLSDKSHERTTYNRNVSKIIEVPTTTYRRMGVQASWNYDSITLFYQNRFKLRNFEMTDLLLQAQVQGILLDDIIIEYNRREPQIPENSIFSVFDAGNTQEFRISGNTRLTTYINGGFLLRHVIFDDDNSNIASVNARYGHISVQVIHQDGYGGASNRLVSTVDHSIQSINIYGKITIGNYHLIEGTWDDLATIICGVNYPVFKRFVLTSELQLLRNRYYAKDLRGLVSLRYRI